MNRLRLAEMRYEAGESIMAPAWGPDIGDLLAVARAAAELPWTERGLLLSIEGMAGLSGPTKDRRLRRLQDALEPLLREAVADDGERYEGD